MAAVFARQSIRAVVPGLLLGAAPFLWLLLVPPFAGGGWFTLLLAAVGALLGLGGCRSPLAWILGGILGLLAGWGLFAAIVGAGWRIVPYAVLGFRIFFAAALVALLIGLVWHSVTRTPGHVR